MVDVGTCGPWHGTGRSEPKRVRQEVGVSKEKDKLSEGRRRRRRKRSLVEEGQGGNKELK